MLSLFGKKFDLKGEIATLYEEVDTINQLKEMVSTPLWQKIHNWVIGKIVDTDAAIVNLSIDPKKNENEIRNRRAFRLALKELLGCIETTLVSETEIKKKLEKYEEVASIAERQQR